MGGSSGMFPRDLSSLLLNVSVVYLVMFLIALGRQLNSLGLKFVNLSASTFLIRWDAEVIILLYVLPNLG